jgi:hypothetical protein
MLPRPISDTLTDEQACKLIDDAKFSVRPENLEAFIKEIKAIYALTDKYKLLDLMNENGMLLAFANPRFQNDYHVALTAVDQNHQAFAFASPDLKNHKGFVQACLHKDPWIIVMDASAQLKKDPELLNQAITANPKLLKILAPHQQEILYKQLDQSKYKFSSSNLFTELKQLHNLNRTNNPGLAEAIIRVNRH